MTEKDTPVTRPKSDGAAVKPQRLWLVHNESSGSNDDDALSALRDAIAASRIELLGETSFPREKPPSPSELDAMGADTAAIFAGDGTISSVVAGWSSWSGAILPLPGGTMNLLARRLHGDATALDILARFQGGAFHRVRPTVILSRHAVGFTGALAGPGTAWAEVREAMREPTLKDLVSTTGEAIAASTGATKVVCLNEGCGREDGYTAISLNPEDDGIEGSGYYADSLIDFARHSFALLQRDFRNGPHESLGRHARIRLACSEGEPMGLLIDGEIYTGAVEEEFVLSTSEVDFWATAGAS